MSSTVAKSATPTSTAASSKRSSQPQLLSAWQSDRAGSAPSAGQCDCRRGRRRVIAYRRLRSPRGLRRGDRIRRGAIVRRLHAGLLLLGASTSDELLGTAEIRTPAFRRSARARGIVRPVAATSVPAGRGSARASTRLRKPGSSASRCPTAALLPDMQPWRPPHGESLLRLVHFATLAHGARRGRVRADAEVEQRDVLTRRPLSQCLRERASGQTRPCVVLRLVRSGSQLGRCRDSRVDLSRRLGIRTRSALGSVAPTVVVST